MPSNLPSRVSILQPEMTSEDTCRSCAFSHSPGVPTSKTVVCDTALVDLRSARGWALSFLSTGLLGAFGIQACWGSHLSLDEKVGFAPDCLATVFLECFSEWWCIWGAFGGKHLPHLGCRLLCPIKVNSLFPVSSATRLPVSFESQP